LIYRITGIIDDDVFAIHVKNIGLKIFTWKEEKKKKGLINLILNKDEVNENNEEDE
jgi:hypothetical protein